MEPPENSSPQETESSHEDQKTPTTTKHKIKNHPRRFTDDQIKSLESIFKKESKLDPRKKLQVARDLGLQPRQVAIWFQNKRARWKSKQLEQEYNLLRSNYDALSLRFEDLKGEKMSLEMQLRELTNLVKNLENIDSSDHRTEEIDHNDEKTIAGNSWEKIEDQKLINWGEDEEEEELGISQTWRNLSSNVGLFDQSSENSNWWDS